ncbi:MAG: hypothetical protein JW724_03230 [Candidatus Altiarchaeota archaeon]|nr:hypothetical protein [Candidatus Altiarchaeota archaeon]
MDGFLVVKDKDFEKLDSDQREWLFLNTLQCLCKEMKAMKTAHIRWSVVGGLIGGAAVMAIMVGGPDLVMALVG